MDPLEYIARVLHSRRNALLLLHFTIFIWGFTGILGKLIQQPTLHLVIMRTIIGVSGLVAVALCVLSESVVVATTSSSCPSSPSCTT